MPSIFLERSNTSENKGPVKTLLVQCLTYKEYFNFGRQMGGIMKMDDFQTINILAFLLWILTVLQGMFIFRVL